jgi:Protein of unknown function (DUF2442)
MSHPIYRIESCQVVGPYRLTVRFNDATVRTIDFLPVLAGRIYGPLKDLGMFNRVRIDPDFHTLTWPTGADFDPATLHDWPKHEAIWRKKAAEWEQVKT